MSRLSASPRSAALLLLLLLVSVAACAAPEAVAQGATIGDTVDLHGRERVTLLAADVDLGGDEVRPPPEGTVYASFHVRIESLAPDARYDRFRFSVSDAEGETFPPTGDGRQPALGSGTVLSTGQAVDGWVSFVVPDDFDSLTLAYAPAFDPDEAPVTFVVQAPRLPAP